MFRELWNEGQCVCVVIVDYLVKWSESEVLTLYLIIYNVRTCQTKNIFRDTDLQGFTYDVVTTLERQTIILNINNI